jgi:hypothetical protein
MESDFGCNSIGVKPFCHFLFNWGMSMAAKRISLGWPIKYKKKAGLSPAFKWLIICIA